MALNANAYYQDLGRVAKLRCPHCHEVTFFHLRGAKRADELCLSCTGCKYHVAVDRNEISAAHNLAELGRRFARRELTAREHADQLQKCELSALRQLLVEAQVNNCPECNEEVPAHFECCWNCGAAVTATTEVAFSDTDAVGFPDPIFGLTPLIAIDPRPPGSEGETPDS